MTGIFMLRTVFAIHPRMTPVMSAITKTATGMIQTQVIAPIAIPRNIPKRPEPNASIPADGTPAPIP